MRIITLNVNGLRSAHAKGFMPWMRKLKPDFVCMQETKAPRGPHAFFHPAEKRGYYTC